VPNFSTHCPSSFKQLSHQLTSFWMSDAKNDATGAFKATDK